MGSSEVAVGRTVDGALTETLRIADQEFDSRLFVGTGKYPDNETMVEAIRASGTAMVTVAVRRVDLDRTQDEGILFHLDPEEFYDFTVRRPEVQRAADGTRQINWPVNQFRYGALDDSRELVTGLGVRFAS